MLYCCDPVLGDVGRGIFVRPGVAEFIRDEAVTHADITTPNQFELEYLTGQAITDIDSAQQACAALRRRGPHTVLLTSFEAADSNDDTIAMLVDSHDGTWLVETPKLPIEPAPNGSGDATAAIFLAKYLETGNAELALEHVTAAIFAVFSATLAAQTRELQFIAAQDEILAPKQHFALQHLR